MNIPTIDLHDCKTISDALEELERGLFLFFQKKEKTIRVIHGIGEGKLATAVHDALEKNPMVISVEESEDGGSCVVRM